jgi:hypothetical protein
MGTDDADNTENGEDILLGDGGVRTYIDCEAGAIWIKRYGTERSPRLTVKVHNVAVTDARLNQMLEALHLAFVDCDQLRVQVFANYDVADMQRVGVAQVHKVVSWMSADTEDGNREDIITHCVDVVAIMLRNTIVGKIARGLVSMMQKMVKPEQPNQICITKDDLDTYLDEIVLPPKVASPQKFKPRPNVPVCGLNTTTAPKPGYEPRGSLSQIAPTFKRIPTQFLVDQDGSFLDKSPSARTTEPSSTSPSDTSSFETPYGPGSPQSDSSTTFGVVGFARPVGSEAISEEVDFEPRGGFSFFKWLSCSCVAPTATSTTDEIPVAGTARE